jgi:hypothetical protein
LAHKNTFWHITTILQDNVRPLRRGILRTGFKERAHLLLFYTEPLSAAPLASFALALQLVFYEILLAFLALGKTGPRARRTEGFQVLSVSPLLQQKKRKKL